tara:strand:- start:118 stop:375 length:258 start_codon:yes stop_codon:yes gene_type:complete
MPQGMGTYGSKKGRPPKKKMPRQGKGSKPNPFSAGASTTKKKTSGKKVPKGKTTKNRGNPGVAGKGSGQEAFIENMFKSKSKKTK